MEYSVLIEPLGDEGFVATVPALPRCRAEGPSREQTLARVRTSIAEMLHRVEVVSLSVDSPANGVEDPWLRVVGQFHDDPAFDPMMRDIYQKRTGEYPEGAMPGCGFWMPIL